MLSFWSKRKKNSFYFSHHRVLNTRNFMRSKDISIRAYTNFHRRRYVCRKGLFPFLFFLCINCNKTVKNNIKMWIFHLISRHTYVPKGILYTRFTYLSAKTQDAGIKPCTVYEMALTNILNWSRLFKVSCFIDKMIGPKSSSFVK